MLVYKICFVGLSEPYIEDFEFFFESVVPQILIA